jgi:ubiquinone/menaquinone biosynthesis C-methylase UbiE
MSIGSAVLRRVLPWLYEPLAPVYDAVAWLGFAGEWAAWRRIALQHVTDWPLVELGCGTGHAQVWARSMGQSSLGVDIAAPMLRQARRRAAGRLARASTLRLPVRDDSAGTLLALFPTAYILDPATWREAERVLRPGGRLIIATHGWLDSPDLHRRLLARAHALLYGRSATLPPLPTSALTTRTVVERSPHGWLHLIIAERGDRGGPSVSAL